MLKIVLWRAKVILIGTTCSSTFGYFLILFLLCLFIKIDLISKLSSLSKLIAISCLYWPKSWLTRFLLWYCITYQLYINIFLFIDLLFLCKTSTVYRRYVLFLIFIRIDSITHIFLVIWSSSWSQCCIVLFRVDKIWVFQRC